MPGNLSQKMFFAFVTVVVIEFVLAYSLEMLVGSPCSFKIACRYFDPRKNHPMIFETMIISATVLVMCPIMSFIAAMNCFNFPFAFFSQLFFIQPFVRTVFKIVFSKDIKARNDVAKEKDRSFQ